jgi:hypothetical protein
MRVSRLIELLLEFQKVYGDLTVMLPDKFLDKEEKIRVELQEVTEVNRRRLGVGPTQAGVMACVIEGE